MACGAVVCTSALICLAVVFLTVSNGIFPVGSTASAAGMRRGDATTMATANLILWSLPSLSFNTRLRRELSRVRGLSSKAKLSNRPELNYIFVVTTGGSPGALC